MLLDRMTDVRERLIRQANIVEKMIAQCRSGLLDRLTEPLRETIAIDEDAVNRLEIQIDELCLNILALYHPEAKDLRTTLMMSRMTSDLERMADCAVNIAESALDVVAKAPLGAFPDLAAMAGETAQMVKDGIRSFIDEDAVLAREVCGRDQRVDDLRDSFARRLAAVMAADPHTIERALHLLRIANNLEKIADISTNIAEETVFIAAGSVIKHHREDPSDDGKQEGG